MRIFVYEFTCGPANRQPCLWDSLNAEGWAMFSALLADFGRIPDAELAILLPETSGAPFALCDEKPPARQAAGPHCLWLKPEDEKPAFRELAQWADYTLVVAPECDDILLSRCRWVEEAGGKLLGPTSDAVQLTGDKWSLGRFLGARHLPTPEARLLAQERKFPADFFPAVLKPRCGAGSLATFLVRNPEDLAACVPAAQSEGWQGELFLQRYVGGQAASISFLIGPHHQLALPPSAQILSPDGRFHYQGGLVPLPPPLAQRAVHLGRRAIEAVTGLQGYVGVDIVLGEAGDGRTDWLIEINPRLTTSYVGLRALARTNLAEAMLHILQGQDPAPLIWRDGIVRFQADGKVDYQKPGETIR